MIEGGRFSVFEDVMFDQQKFWWELVRWGAVCFYSLVSSSFLAHQPFGEIGL